MALDRQISDGVSVSDQVLGGVGRLFDRGGLDDVEVVDLLIAGLGLFDVQLGDAVTAVDDLMVSPGVVRVDQDINVGANLGTRSRSAQMSLVVQGTQGFTVPMDVHLRGEQQLLLPGDLVVEVPLPNRYMRLRGDLLTRYFGGDPSDANFPEGFDPTPGNLVVQEEIGRFNHSHRKVIYQGPNDIPTASTYDKYGLVLASGTIPGDTIGLRVITSLRLNVFGPNSNVIFGLTNGQLGPFDDIANGRLTAFGLELEKGFVTLRGWHGGATGVVLAREDIVGRNLVVEQEVVANGPTVVEFRLFDRDLDLDNPLRRLSISGGSVANVDRFFISSLGRHTPELPTAQPDMSVAFDYADVEPGSGSLYATSPTLGIVLGDVKWRPIQSRPPIQLRAQGSNTLRAALSPDGIAATIEAVDTIEVDDSDPVITVVALETDSAVRIGSNPQVVKGSLQLGFSGISLVWKADKPGTYTLRVNSTGATDGIEIQSGDYPVADTNLRIDWDFADLPQVDGTYDVTLYLIADTGKPAAKGVGIFIL